MSDELKLEGYIYLVDNGYDQYNVTEIYFIVSVDTFISRLKDKILVDTNFSYNIKTQDSSKGKYFEIDC